MASWRETISKYLSGLPHTGEAGFEGLVAALLAAATGQRFRIAGAGLQFGRDIDSEPGFANSIAVEAKHYNATKLDRRELISEVAEATLNRPDLDLWVLTCTCPVSTQLRDSLSEHAAKGDIELLIIDKGIDGLPRLPALMAEYPDAVRLWAQHNSQPLSTAVEASLAEVPTEPDFRSAVEDIISKLNSAELGYDGARSASNRKLIHVLSDRGRAHRFFNQQLHVRAGSQPLIKRNGIRSLLDGWWESGMCSRRRAVVLGEEGVGKSWAVMDWVADGIQAGAMPLVLPFSANPFPLRSHDTIESVVPRLLLQWSERGTEKRWTARLHRWIRNHAGERPLILVVADGLNESTVVGWASFFRALEDQDWNRAIAVLATDRTGHWKPSCEQAGFRRFLELDLEDYTDPELEQALAGFRIPLSAIPQELQKLIRNPRLCELAAHHFDEMLRDHDFTRERLLFLDMMHRQDARPGHPLTPKEFEDVVCRLAIKYRDSGVLGVPELHGLFPADPEGKKYQEIIDGGLLRPVTGLGTRYAVEPTRLAFGLGLVLADALRKTAEVSPDRASVEEAVARATDPRPDMDLKVRICESAIAHAFRDSGYPAIARLELLRHWIGLRNWAESAQSAFGGYVCKAPQDFVALAEDLWCSRQDRGTAQEFLFGAIAEHRDDAEVQPAIVAAASRWLGLIHAAGHPYDRRDRQSLQDAIESRLGQPLTPGSTEVCGVPVTVVEDDERASLVPFAFRLISAGPRLPFLKAFVGWAVASAVMRTDAASDHAAWVLRLSDEDLETPLMTEARRLITVGGEVAEEAAHTILWCLGTADAKQLATERPRPESVSARRLREEHAVDPCRGWFPWTDEDCLRCSERTDIHVLTVVQRLGDRVFDPAYPIPVAFVQRCIDALRLDPAVIRAGMGRTDADSRFDGLLPVLASKAPSVLAEFVRSVVRTLAERGIERRYSLAVWLPDVSLLLSTREVTTIRQTLQQLRESAGTWASAGQGNSQRPEEIMEADAFLAVAPHLDAQEFADDLLARPAKARDWVSLASWFRPLPQAYVRTLLDAVRSTSHEVTLRRILWLLPSGKPNLTDEDRIRIVELAQSPEWGIRDSALRFACLVDDDSLGRQLLELIRPFAKERRGWGTELVLRHSGHLAFETAAGLLQPDTAGHLLERRGNLPCEIRVYGRSLDRWWRSAISAIDSMWPAPDSPDPSDAEDVAAADVAAEWSGFAYGPFEACDFDLDALRLVCRELPGKVQKWVTPALGETRAAERLRAEMMPVLSEFCCALLDVDPVIGLSLWRTLARQTDGMLFQGANVALFAADNAQTERARWSALATCLNDQRVSEFALLAELNGRTSWLKETAADLVSRQPLWRRAQGLTLASFSDIEKQAFEGLVNRARIAGTWVEETLEWMRSNVERNLVSRRWYRAFLSAAESDVAWAALQLFLARTDRRFKVWRRTSEQGIPAGHERLRYRYALKDRIDRAFEESDRGLKSTLFGREIRSIELAPFQ